MTTVENLIEIENKYKNMENSVMVLSEKVKENDVVNTMTNNFRFLLAKKNVSALDSSILSEVFGFSLIMFEEAMEKERKERFFSFVSATFSKENLRGKVENELYEKMLKRMENKFKKEEEISKVAKNNLKK